MSISFSLPRILAQYEPCPSPNRIRHLYPVFKRLFQVSAVRSYRISKKKVVGVGGRCQAVWCYFMGTWLDTLSHPLSPNLPKKVPGEKGPKSILSKRVTQQEGVHLAQQSILTSSFFMGPSPRVSQRSKHRTFSSGIS